MELKRIAIPVGVAVGLIALVSTLELLGRMNGRSPVGAAIGADESGGCNAAPEVDEEQAKNVQVSDNHIERLAKKVNMTRADVDEDLLTGEFVIKLREGAASRTIIDGGALRTGSPALDAALQRIGQRDAGRVPGLNSARGVATRHLGLHNIYIIATDADPEVVEDELELVADVEYVEPLARQFALRTPNDGLYGLQWHMHQMGVETVWNTTEGEGITVAVIDTGVSANEDGYLTLLQGYDFVDDDTDATDLEGHGTHVAGTVAQRTFNGVGVAGMAPQAKILPVRVLDEDGSGFSSRTAEGIIWAVDNGADVINLSLGGLNFSQVSCDAVAYAYNNGVPVIAATGNDSFLNGVNYPAACDFAFAVGAVDQNSQVTHYSNEGDQIDLVAPGGDTSADVDGNGQVDGVLQETFANGGQWSYWYFQGTSMATPHVAGAAALLLSSGVSGTQNVYDALTSSAVDLGAPGWDTAYGYGLLDPVAALDVTQPPPPVALELKKLRAVKIKRRRATLRWRTNLAATSTISGSNGFSYSDDDPVTAHKVVVSGRRGETVTFTVTSEDREGRVVTDTETVTFAN